MNRGFTLLELLIVVIVIGILATLAIPSYNRSKEQALGKEALTNLRLIAAAEKIYRMETTTFWPSAGTSWSLAEINSNLRLYLTTTNWTWSITGAIGPPPTFTASADRNGSGGYLDCQYTINQTGTEWSAASCP